MPVTGGSSCVYQMAIRIQRSVSLKKISNLREKLKSNLPSLNFNHLDFYFVVPSDIFPKFLIANYDELSKKITFHVLTFYDM